MRKNVLMSTVVSALLLSSMLFSPAQASAAADIPTALAENVQQDFVALDSISNAVMPQWKNTSYVGVGLRNVDGMVECSSVVQGMSGTTSVQISGALYRRETNGSYSFLCSFPMTTSSGAFGQLLGFYPGVNGTVYRFTVTCKVVRNGVPETISEEIIRTFVN